MPQNAKFPAILAKKARENPIFCNYGPTTEQMFPFAGAGLTLVGALVERRWEGPTEDPVKNGVSFNDC